MNGTRSKHTDALRLGNRIKVALVLLCVGLVGLGLVSAFIYQKADAVEELSSYATRGAINNVSDIFEIPAIMFFAIIILYAISELYKSYKAMNDPDTYRQGSSARVGMASERRVKRAEVKSKRQTTARKSRGQSSRQLSRQGSDQTKAPRRRQITDQSKDRSVGLSVDQIPKSVSKPTRTGRTRRDRVR